MILSALLSAVISSQAIGADPPGRIGRVSFLSGSVSFRAGGSDDWAAATLNYPITTGDELRSPAGARAEVHVGSSAVRLGPQTTVDFIDVSDQSTRLRLTQGSLYVRVRELRNGDAYEVDTPDGAVALLDPGHYRIDVHPDGQPTTITVRDGKAQMSTTGGATVSVSPGETVSVTGPSSPASLTTTVAVDDWETWCEARDRRDDESISLRYVSPEWVGFEDLDEYGAWEIDASFGPVWVPRVSVGWAPYRFGSWAWVAPWGWTWIDDAPWGFAPFHYGRWAFRRGGWVWVPGEMVPFPVYAPALVAFVGGSGFDLSLDFGAGGGLAWFPLAPGEVYVPAYRVSRTYIRDVNVTSVNVKRIDVTKINVTKVRYANRSAPGAVTAVSKETFLRGGQVAKAAVRVPTTTIAKATVVGTAAPVSPTRESVAPRAVVTHAGTRDRSTTPAPTRARAATPAPTRAPAAATEEPRRQALPVSSLDASGQRQPQEREAPTQRQHVDTSPGDRRHHRKRS